MINPSRSVVSRLAAGLVVASALAFAPSSFAQAPEATPANAAAAPTLRSLPKITHVIRNQDFRVLQNPQFDDPAYTDIVMFFWYGSPWAAQTEPLMRQWIEQGRAPGNVRFHMVPVVLSSDWAFSARIFYTLEEMKLQRHLTPKLLAAVSQKKVDLSSPKSVKTWLEGEGVSAEKFEEVINGPRVIARMATIMPMTRQYEVRSTPTFIIDGRYHIGANEKLPPARAAAVTMFMAEQLSKGGPRP